MVVLLSCCVVLPMAVEDPVLRSVCEWFPLVVTQSVPVAQPYDLSLPSASCFCPTTGHPDHNISTWDEANTSSTTAHKNDGRAARWRKPSFASLNNLEHVDCQQWGVLSALIFLRVQSRLGQPDGAASPL